MGTNNRKKSLKDIKGLDKAHPYSRKATQMKRAIQRTEILSQKQKSKKGEKELKVIKLAWFKDFKRCDFDGLKEAVEKYINRNAVEIKELKDQMRPNRPKPSRLLLLENLYEQQLQEYIQSGFEVPDLRDSDTIYALQHWNEDYNAISTIKLVRIKKDQEE